MKRALIDEIKKGTSRQIVITFPDGEYEEITKGIHSGSASLEKSFCDDTENVVIEGCIASAFKVTVEGIEDLSNTKIKVSQRIEGYELELFTGNIDSCPLQRDRKSRIITAYDDLYKYADVNVAEWYNSLSYPMPIEDLLKSLLKYVGIPYTATLDIRQSFDVEKTLDTSSMSFITVIKAICGVIGGFGIINPRGEFDIVYLSNDVAEDTLQAMSGFELEQYTVEAIDKVVIRSEETDIGGSCGDGTNAYIIQGNFLCFGMDAEQLNAVASKLYDNVAGFEWRPCLFELGISNPLIGCDGLRYRVTTTQGDDFETYIFNSYISGAQLFNQELESFGSKNRKEVVADDYTDALINAYRVMKIKATVDGFELEIGKKVGEDELITKINASAEQVKISSVQIDIEGLVKFINEDKSDVTEIDGGRLRNKSISTEKLLVENLSAVCANLGGFTINDGALKGTGSAWIAPAKEDLDALSTEIQEGTTEDFSETQKKAYDFNVDGIIDLYDFAICKNIILRDWDITEKYPDYEQIESDINIQLNPSNSNKVIEITGTNSFGRDVDVYFGLKGASVPRIDTTYIDTYNLNAANDVVAQAGTDNEISLVSVNNNMPKFAIGTYTISDYEAGTYGHVSVETVKAKWSDKNILALVPVGGRVSGKDALATVNNDSANIRYVCNANGTLMLHFLLIYT